MVKPKKREDTILYPLLDYEPDNDLSDGGDDLRMLSSAGGAIDVGTVVSALGLICHNRLR